MATPPARSRIAVTLLAAAVAAGCGLGAGMLALDATRAPPALVAPDGASLKAVPMERALRSWPAYAPGPARAPIAPDEWTSDAPALQAELTRKPIAAAPAPPPPQPTAAAAQTPPPSGPAPAAAPAALAMAAPSDDKAKICRAPAVPLDIARAVAAESRRLRDEPSLRGKPLDIPPPGPPPDEERRIRLSALLTDALGQ